MLPPDTRQLYSDALRPPPGYRFDEGVATTFTLDLSTLLTVPLHLALYDARDSSEELLEDGIALLEALRATASRLTVFCDEGRIHPPDVPRVLYSLLEPVVLQARAPGGGAFHPKLWVLRFNATDPSRPPLIRLLVLSRNLTRDRCWDLLLTLDGHAVEEAQPLNAELAAFVEALPGMAASRPAASNAARCEQLAGEVARCAWELPGRFESVRFHTLGVGENPPWRPESTRDLVVISPFVTAEALDLLTGDGDPATLLVSRTEELANIREESRSRFAEVMVLDELAEAEDGEAVPDYREPGVALKGLHAKAYIYRKGWDTHLVMGSANVTTAALIAENNVELLADLRGKASQVGDPSEILGENDFASILAPYFHDEEAALDEDEREAEQVLEAGRRVLLSAGLRLRCERADGSWTLVLEGDGQGEALEGIADVRAWPITLDPDKHATEASGLLDGGTLQFDVGDVALLTAFVAFSLETASGHRTSFVLNLPVDGLPVEDRNASILRGVIRNRQGFVRYLLLLLGEEDGMLGGAGGFFDFTGGSGSGRSVVEDLPLLEQMTRAYSRDPVKLKSIRRLIEELEAGEGGDTVVPAEFWAVWPAFQSALGDEA